MENDKDLENNNIQTPTVATPVAVARKKSVGKIIGIIIGSIIAFIILIVVLIMSGTDAPLKVSDAFVNNIQTSQSAAGYKLMTDAAKAATTTADFDAMVAQVAPILTGKPSVISREIAAATDVPAAATVVYEIQGTDGKYNMTINLQENNKVWQVLNFESKKIQ